MRINSHVIKVGVLALIMSFSMSSCKSDAEELSPNPEIESTDAIEEAFTAENCPSGLVSQMSTTTCPNNKKCGCELITGLAANKKAYWDAGHAPGIASDLETKEFLGAAMLETTTMNPKSYTFGDVEGDKKTKKVGFAANGGAIKQNVFVLSVAVPGLSDTYIANVNRTTRTPTACPAGKTCWNTIVDILNNNRSWDINKFVVSKKYFATLFRDSKAWYRTHRGGASYLTEAYVERVTATVKSGVKKVKIVNRTRLDIVTADGIALRDDGWVPNRERRGTPIHPLDKGLGAFDDTEFYIKGTDFCRNNLFFSKNGNYKSTDINNFPNMLNGWRFWADVINI